MKGLGISMQGESAKLRTGIGVPAVRGRPATYAVPATRHTPRDTLQLSHDECLFCTQLSSIEKSWVKSRVGAECISIIHAPLPGYWRPCLHWQGQRYRQPGDADSMESGRVSLCRKQ